MSNKILSLEKGLTAVIEEYKKTNDEKFILFKNKTDIDLKGLTSDILELKAYKYDMEGKMGGIIFTIEALEKCLKDEPYLLEFRLQDLKDKIGKYILSPELFIRLKDILNKAKNIKDKDYSVIIGEIENLIKVESNPKI